MWIIIEIKLKVKVPSTPSSFFPNRASNFVLRNLCHLMKYLIHVPNIILVAVDDYGDYDGDANYD